MTLFVALFRGINVGGKNKLPMKELASIMESCGAASVRTYIQSGNVVFEAARAAMPRVCERIKEGILGRHGFSPEIVVLDRAAFERAVSRNPFPEADAEPKSVHVTFLSARPKKPDLEALVRIRRPSERFELSDRVFFVHAPDGIGKSKLATRIETSLGVSGTSRNWRTVVKLQEMLREPR